MRLAVLNLFDSFPGSSRWEKGMSSETAYPAPDIGDHIIPD